MWCFAGAYTEGGIASITARTCLLLPRVRPAETHCPFGRQAPNEMERDRREHQWLQSSGKAHGRYVLMLDVRPSRGLCMSEGLSSTF